MAISRPLLVILIGAVLALVGFYATSGARNSADSGEPATSAPDPGAKAKGEGAPPPDAKAGKRRPGAARPPRSGAKPGPGSAAPPRTPAAVTRALARKRTVVLFFYQRGAADDGATARSVSALRGRPGVSVFSAPLSRLGDYQAVIRGAGVSQAPAVVILGRNRQASLIEGFVDRETLTQQVVDAR